MLGSAQGKGQATPIRTITSDYAFSFATSTTTIIGSLATHGKPTKKRKPGSPRAVRSFACRFGYRFAVFCAVFWTFFRVWCKIEELTVTLERGGRKQGRKKNPTALWILI